MNETLDAVILKSHFTANFIKYLFVSGLLFFLTRRFSTDNIERFHGPVRNHFEQWPSSRWSRTQCHRKNKQNAIGFNGVQHSSSNWSDLKKSDPILTERKSKCTRERVNRASPTLKWQGCNFFSRLCRLLKNQCTNIYSWFKHKL